MLNENQKNRPLLFVHGAWHGAWCWEEWVEYFKAQGFTANTVDLRGHGYKRGEYKGARLKNYINDVKLIISEFDSPPILIGHSLGCTIIQNIIADYDFPAAVLIAPIPESKYFKRVFLKQLARHPILSLRSILTYNMKPWIANPASRKLFFSDNLSAERAQKYLSDMQGESLSLFLLDLLHKTPPITSKTPIMLVAAENDSFFNTNVQRRTAEDMGADMMVAHNSGHDVMLDTGQELTRDKIAQWIHVNIDNES